MRYGPQSYEGNIESKIVLDLPIDIKRIKKNGTVSSEREDDDGKYDNQSLEFLQVLKKIHKNLKSKLIKKEKDSIEGDTLDKVKYYKGKKRDTYIECLKEKTDLVDTQYQHYNLKTKIHSMNGKPYLKIYHSNRKLNKEQKLRMHHLTRFIIHLESIWYFEDSYGFNWYTVQAEIKLPEVPQQYTFYNSNPLPDEIEEDIDYENPILQKFIKMKKMGIPQPVIENKMRLCGLDTSILYPNSNTNLLPPPILSNHSGLFPPPIPSNLLPPSALAVPPAPPPPPPPPPPPLPGSFGQLPNSEPKKTDVNPIAEFRPSLQQLQERLKNLRKVKK